jgi:excisionase family DNA binding protein
MAPAETDLPPQVTVTGPAYWAEHVAQLAQLLATSSASILRDPSGRAPSADDVLYITLPDAWAANQQELRDALAFAAGTASPAGSGAAAPRTAAGVVAPVEQRLVYTVEEAATLLGISRSFAYEAVQRGDIPSMRFGRRIVVPKAALERFLSETGGTGGSDA